jgi:kynureninase
VVHTVESLAATPNSLASHYSHFRVDERILLTGHSHQAWPDAGLEGQTRAWLDAAEYVDAKWERARRQADRVREGYRRLLDDPAGLYSLGPATHDLLVKFLSALPLHRESSLVTTDSEFYSLRRQLDRLEEEGLEIVRVAAVPADTVGERLAAAVNGRAAAVLASTVFFSNAHIAGGLEAAASACRRHGIPLLLDAYHQLNIVPWSLREAGLEDAYVVGAGYKYCQLGEGVAFLRYPPDCALRPVATGWFAEFGELTAAHEAGRVTYDAGHDRFAGATYDPTSHYRAAAVFDFFDREALIVPLLRDVSQHQMGRLVAAFDRLDLNPRFIRRDRSVPLQRLAGFLALESPYAAELHAHLLARGVFTDFRGEILRLGPAPYLSDAQLDDAIGQLDEVVRTLT